MSIRGQNTPPPGSSRRPGFLRYRTLAILVMLAGAAAFAVTVLAFEGDVLCLSASTLVTLVGLGINVGARRMGWDPAETAKRDRQAAEPGIPPPTRRGSVPPGLRRKSSGGVPPEGRGAGARSPLFPTPEIARQNPMPPRTAPEPPRMIPPEDDLVFPSGPLADEVIAVLEERGAEVQVTSSREDRCVLQVRSPNGRLVTALVLEGPELVEVSEARALVALVNAEGSALGLLIAAGGFAPRTYAWASMRQNIRLVASDELDELGI
jgi:hypothetical protein